MPTPLRGLAERQSCATRSLRKAIPRYGCYERRLKGISVLRRPAERQSCATRSLRKAILCYGRSKRPFQGPSGPPQDLPRTGPFAMEICLAEGKTEARGKPRRVSGNRLQANVSTRYLVLRVLRRKDTTKAGAKGGTEAPGRQERTNWTACEAPGRHQGGRKGSIEQPGRHQGSTRDAGKD